MNIVLLLNNDIASNLALNLLLPSLQVHNIKVFYPVKSAAIALAHKPCSS